MAKSVWEMDFKDGVTRAVAAMEKTVSQAFGSMTSQEKRFESAMSGAAKAADQAASASGRMGSAASHIGQAVPHMQQFTQEAHSAEGGIMALGEQLMAAAEAAGVLFAAEKVVEWGEKILDVTAEFEGFINRINFASIDTADGVKNINFLKQAVKDLHLPVQQVYEGFSQMEAGLKGFVEGDNLRGLGKGVLTAAATLHLGQAELGRTLYDFKEIGERGFSAKYENSLSGNLPGINDVVRKAFGKSMHQLGEEGMSGTTFLTKIGPALEQYFKGGLENWSHSLQAKMNDTANAVYLTQVDLGERLKPVYMAIMDSMTSMIHAAGTALADSIDWIKDHTNDIRYEIAQMVTETQGMFGSIGDFLKPLSEPLDRMLHGIWSGLKALAGPLLQFRSQFGSALEFLRDGFGRMLVDFGRMIEYTGKAFGAIVDVLHTMYVFLDKIGMIDAVVGIFHGLQSVLHGIGDMFIWIYDHTLRPIFEGIGMAYGMVKDLLGIQHGGGKSLVHGAGSEWSAPATTTKNKGYNTAAGGTETHEKKEGTSHRSVTVTIMKLVGIENVHVNSVAEATAIAADKVTTSMIGAVRDFETGIAVAQ